MPSGSTYSASTTRVGGGGIGSVLCGCIPCVGSGGAESAGGGGGVGHWCLRLIGMGGGASGAAEKRRRATGAGVDITPGPPGMKDTRMETSASASGGGFVDVGLERWKEGRAAWTAEPVPRRGGSKRLTVSQEEDVYDELLSPQQRPFPKNTSLGDVIRLLPNVWERERIQVVMARPR